MYPFYWGKKIPFGGGACRSFLSFSILLITWNKFYVWLGCQRVYCYVNYYFYYLLFVFPSDCICWKDYGTCDNTKNLEFKRPCLWVILGLNFPESIPFVVPYRQSLIAHVCDLKRNWRHSSDIGAPTLGERQIHKAFKDTIFQLIFQILCPCSQE